MSSVSTSDDPVLIVFDVECTGSDFVKHAMVELGAVCYPYRRSPKASDSQKDKRARVDRKPCSTFEMTMRVPEDREWDARCVREFWENPERPEYEQLKAKKKVIETCPMSPEAGMTAFVTWVKTIVVLEADGDSSRIRFVSDNAAYDAAWIGIYLCQYADHLPLTVFFDDKFQAVIDTSSYHQGLSRVDHVEERLIKKTLGHYSEDRECRRVLMVPEGEVPTAVHDHRAVHDAQEIAEQHLIILKHAREWH